MATFVFSAPLLVHAEQISPAPNPLGSTITVTGSNENAVAFDNLGNIIIVEAGSLQNTLTGVLNNNLSDNSAVYYSGNAFNAGQLDVNIGGTLHNQGTLNNNSVLNNYDGGVLNNDGTINTSFRLTNHTGGVLNNNLGGVINVNPGVSLNVIDSNGSAISIGRPQTSNWGTLNNYGTVNVHDSFYQMGNFNNDGTLTIKDNGTVSSECCNSILNNDNKLDINAGGSLYMSHGTLNNNATLTNNGNMQNVYADQYNSGTLNNNSVMVNNARIFNSGTLNNEGSLTSSAARDTAGRLYNNGGTITNNGSITQELYVDNDGKVTNNSMLNTLDSMQLSDGGTLTNNSGGTLISNTILNYGTLINEGTMTTSGPLHNGASSSAVVTMMNNGAFTSNGSLTNDDTITNTGSLFNNDTLTNQAGSTLTNSGTLTNSSSGTLTNNRGGKLNNNGTLINENLLENQGTFTNSGTLTNNGTLSNSNFVNRRGKLFSSEFIVNTGSNVNGTGAYVQTGELAVTTIDGTISQSIVNISAGSINGIGSIIADSITIGELATVNPGNSPGTLIMLGDVYMMGTQVTEIQDSLSFDMLEVQGEVTLFDTSHFDFLFDDSYLAQNNDLFTFLTADAFNFDGGLGFDWTDMSNYTVDGLASGFEWSVAYVDGFNMQSSYLSLLITDTRSGLPSNAVSASGTTALFALSLTLMGWLNRRQSRQC
ncbi:MAG: hypothetical protein HWE26_05795 [Alteromonadaceae bacterium]|nr:hypothetical protein [Alteromonadaceae bacterium]